mgnify:CR=1 FL=1
MIQGSPGTGKTFVTSLCVKAWRQRYGLSTDDELAIATPTHKAKKVVKDYLESMDINIDVFTIHSILGKGLVTDEDEGKQRFTSSGKELPIHDYEIVWVDEFSMVGQDLCNDLFANANRLLFTGDIRQLLPVKETSFPVWDKFQNAFMGDEVAVLENPQRFDGDIADFVYACIPYIDDNRCIDVDKYLGVSDQIKLSRKWFEAWKKSDFEGDESVILTYTNSDVDKLNERCREYILGSPGEPLQIGERVVAYQPLECTLGRQVANNGDMLTITGIEPSQIDTNYGEFDSLDYYFNGADSGVRQIAPWEAKRWDKFLSELKAKAKAKKIRWGSYYYHESLSAVFKPPYALTIHKSQGSGYKDVFVLNTFNWLKDGELQPRLHYVAASRAKQTLHYAKNING